MIAQRLSTEALYVVLAGLLLGILVMAQSGVRAYSLAEARPGVAACVKTIGCAASGAGGTGALTGDVRTIQVHDHAKARLRQV